MHVKRSRVVNYKLFKFRAVIDWLEIEFRTQEHTNFQSIKRVLNAPYVEALNKEDGGRANKFSVKFHDPKNWDAILHQLQTLSEKFPLAENPTIKTIEVSIDGYSRTADRSQMIALTHSLFRGLSKLVSDNYRFSGTKNSIKRTRWFDSKSEIIEFLNDGRNICIGNIAHSNSLKKNFDADDEYMQIYYKTTDNGGTPLQPAQYRARIEIRLSGKALPFENIEDAKTYKFEKLAKYFNMRKLNQTLLNTAPRGIQKACELVHQLGSAKSNSKRKHAVITVANKELNDKFYDSLRDLSRRMHIAQKAGKI